MSDQPLSESELRIVKAVVAELAERYDVRLGIMDDRLDAMSRAVDQMVAAVEKISRALGR